MKTLYGIFVSLLAGIVGCSCLVFLLPFGLMVIVISDIERKFNETFD
jgi:hypothetical protein